MPNDKTGHKYQEFKNGPNDRVTINMDRTPRGRIAILNTPPAIASLNASVQYVADLHKTTVREHNNLIAVKNSTIAFHQSEANSARQRAQAHGVTLVKEREKYMTLWYVCAGSLIINAGLILGIIAQYVAL